MQIDIFLDKIAKEISTDRAGSNYANEVSPRFQTTGGTRLNIKEVQTKNEFVGALHVCHIPGKFLTVDRILGKRGKYNKSRRILYDLETRSGQIGAALFLALLKIENGDRFSKHQFIEEVEKEYFLTHDIIVPTSEITEVLSRMFRKTLDNFFGINGRYFARYNFLLKFTELEPSRRDAYLEFKNRIDKTSSEIIHGLNSPNPTYA